MKILIIGLGSIAKKHIAALRQIGAFEIIALRSSPNPVNYEHVINVFDIEEAIEGVDFVILSNPTYQHADTLVSLSKFKKPLFIEKPPVADLLSAEQLSIDLKELTTYVACNLRFLPCINFLKKNLNLKRINEVNVYAGSYLPDWRPGIDYTKNYSAQKGMGGGVHLDLFHEIDYISWIFGPPLVTSGYFSSKSTLSIDAVDYANLIWQYDRANISIVLNYYRKKAKREIEILFDNDIWTVDLLSNNITNMFGQVIFQSNENISETYRRQLEYFLSCLNANIKPMNSFSGSIANLKLCLEPDYEIK